MRSNGHGVPVVALDIDGTIGDYHTHFLRFAQDWVGMKMPSVLAINPGKPLWEHMGIRPELYRECKLAFRQGGLKRSMPVYDWASELTQVIREEFGWEVWICTTRPYLRLDNIDPDTREWLRRNGIGYDAVLFDRVNEKGSKYDELKRQAGDRVVAVFDDLPEMVQEANALGFRTFLRDQPYNRHLTTFRRVQCCRDIEQVLRGIRRAGA